MQDKVVALHLPLAEADPVLARAAYLIDLELREGRSTPPTRALLALPLPAPERPDSA